MDCVDNVVDAEYLGFPPFPINFSAQQKLFLQLMMIQPLNTLNSRMCMAFLRRPMPLLQECAITFSRPSLITSAILRCTRQWKPWAILTAWLWKIHCCASTFSERYIWWLSWPSLGWHWILVSSHMPWRGFSWEHRTAHRVQSYVCLENSVLLDSDINNSY